MNNPQLTKEDIEVIYLPNENKHLNESNNCEISEIMRTSFYDLIKYSQVVRENVICEDMINNFTKQLELLKSSFNIQIESIKIFFRLLQNENIEITSEQYSDLYRLSEYFQVCPLMRILNGYFNRHNTNINFIINLFIDQIATQNVDHITNLEFSKEMEECLSSKIDECIANANFWKLPISIIYRIIERSDKQQIPNDLLYDFISKNIEERNPLFLFLNIRKLTDEKFNSLYELFESCKSTKKNNITNYLLIDLDYIKHLKDENKQKEEHIIQLKRKIEDKQKKLNQQNQDFQSQLVEAKKKIEQFQSENEYLKNNLKEVELERDHLNKHDKRFAERIRSIIPSNKDDEIINIFESDFQFSHNVRNIFTNCSDNEIVVYVNKDTKLSSGIRNFFKSGDDSWIKSQIEENHKEIPQLKNQINNLNQEKKDLINLSSELKTKLQNLQSDNQKLNEDYQNLQNKFHQNEELIAKLIKENEEVNKKLDEPKKVTPKSSKIECNMKVFDFDGNSENRLNGIISHLTKEVGGNVVDNKIVNITSSTIYVSSQSPKNAADFIGENFFASNNNNIDQWIMYDFKKRKIHPTKYSIKTRHDNDLCNPQQWCIEVSNTGNGSDWRVIDSRSDVKSLRTKNQIDTFDIQNKLDPNKRFQFIRLRQTGKSTGDYWFLVISAIEFFGTLYDE